MTDQRTDTPTTSTALVPTEPALPAARTIRAGTPVAAFVPQSFDEAMKIARVIALSGMAPRSYNNDEAKVLVGMMTGAEVGLTPMQSLRGVAVIGNQPSLWGDVALGLVLSTGLVDDMVETQDGDFDNLNSGDGIAVCTIKRKGRPSPVTRRFGMIDARRSGLLNKAGPWKDGYRPRMCQMRARGYALRDLFADVLAGLGVAESEDEPVTLLEQTQQHVATQRLASVHDLEVQAAHEEGVSRGTGDGAGAPPSPPPPPSPTPAPARRQRVRKAAGEGAPPPPAEGEQPRGAAAERRPATDQDRKARTNYVSMIEGFGNDVVRYEEQQLPARAESSRTLMANTRAALDKLEREVDFGDTAAGPAAAGPGYEERQNPDDPPEGGGDGIYTREGYDLNAGGSGAAAAPEGQLEGVDKVLADHLGAIRAMELVADIKSYVPTGLEGDPDRLMTFESQRGALVRTRTEEARRR